MKTLKITVMRMTRYDDLMAQYENLMFVLFIGNK